MYIFMYGYSIRREEEQNNISKKKNNTKNAQAQALKHMKPKPSERLKDAHRTYVFLWLMRTNRTHVPVWPYIV